MSTKRAHSALKLFEAALDVPPADRTRWLNEMCDDDAALAAEVESLLAAYAETGDFLVLEDDKSRLSLVSQPIHVAESLPFRGIGSGTCMGDFLLEEQIGAGGMGIVYRAQQLSLGRLVAVKVLPPYLAYSSNARARFRREVEAVARLRHPHIVGVYASGQEQEISYYAMELIDGPALSQIINYLRKNPIVELKSSTVNTFDDVTDAVKRCIDPLADEHERELIPSRLKSSYFDAISLALAEVADGLAYAHHQQVVHRDIKPSNLLFSQDGQLHISDFGLARMLEAPGVTVTGEWVGTPYYMAPEQLALGSSGVDGRCDIYALGATLYELLTLRPPFSGDNRDQVIAQIARDNPAPPKRVNQRVPRDLDTICLKALQKDPTHRYQSADEMGADLRRFANRQPIAARRTSIAGRTVHWVGRHPGVATMLAGMCFLALVATFFAYRSYVSETRWTTAQHRRVFEAAQLAVMEGNLHKARAAIDEAEQLGAPAGMVHLLNGHLELRSGQYQQACDELELAVLEMPQSVAAISLLSQAYESNSQHEESARYAERLPSLMPVTLEDYLFLGLAQKNRDVDTALATLDQAIELDRTSVVARFERGSILVRRAFDTAEVRDAEAALNELQIAAELLEPSAHLYGRMLQAQLAAATAYEVAGRQNQSKEQLRHAGVTAKALKQFPDEYNTHRFRAFYFDYIGETQQAIAEWRLMKDKRIAYLVLTLFRTGEFDEALQLCDERLKRFGTARFTDFFRAFVMAGITNDPASILAAFEIAGEEALDPATAYWMRYTIHCLAGDLPRAQTQSRQLKTSGRRTSSFPQWHLEQLDYMCGDTSSERLLDIADRSRPRLCSSHFLIGVTQLAVGERTSARAHFAASVTTRMFDTLDYAMSRALLGQLDREPSWPTWIPVSQSDPSRRSLINDMTFGAPSD